MAFKRYLIGHWNWCHSKAWVWFPIRLL